ncbi:glycerol-3-phosphate 1-O-acyltransferase PlsB [Thalassotalea sp. 1_MG-2023]|uniref:glycerol-3-phosphate 1-O-acyltransferase PlsB n=1 Tax=Thalassotalea sp. 1_MG-2023 TaxID=3062680 RepID=UPI0026E24FC8|nr:glycerol-3-phosphate 1-O-acyltransferase PlsB [Thalassotalea sp. 1_MG-2023]MDO6425428.1 glycerol-3-phosphate 1-O-acyltransferase PlsB [Thalassotalea sp. 1_MG-2023]
MLALRSFFYLLLKFPIFLWVKCRIVADELSEQFTDSERKPIFYIVRHRSASDLLALQKSCKKLALPDPLSNVTIKGQVLPRTICIDTPSSLLFNKKNSSAMQQSLAILNAHEQDENLAAQLIPASLVWGRKPTKEKNNTGVREVLAEQESPSWLKKFFIVLFLGRNTLVRFSEPLSIRYMTDKFGSDESNAHKLLRVARFHFHRQKVAATGPRLMHRQQMFKTLLKNPSIVRLMEDERQAKGLSKEAIEKQALIIMDEIAGDYREGMIRIGERVLHWLWNRLYSGINVNNANTLRELADDGQEIIYVPCHRSHMDYLLLTYIIYQQGLVTPRIAAGINLNFWPAGPIFRKAGAFFIRRSFKGNRMYSAIFREYLGLLFERGYSVKYYSEGGRSRTGKLLEPKTGMLAMTIQSLLRGINRPLTLVPVYLGYEHVMEVGTYYKELSGSKKQNESIFGVLKAIKNLRNYGKGFVNFGTPININQFLNQHVENWKDDVDPIDPQKPSWLTPSVNLLANQVMVAINKCAALNGVSLVAMVLHATENKALPRSELEYLLNFFLSLQKAVPYSDELTIPDTSGSALLADVIALKKVIVDKDSCGDIISLGDFAALEMRYYRNNVLHAYILPALICRLLDRTTKISSESIHAQIQQFIVLLKNDLFLWQCPAEVNKQIDNVLHFLSQENIVKQSKAGFWSLVENTETQNYVQVLGEVADETLQRFAIITSLATRLSPISKNELSEKAVSIAKRLSVVNNINAPEFIDKKAQLTLINSMKEQEIFAQDDSGKLTPNSTLITLKENVNNLVDISVLQSIAR